MPTPTLTHPAFETLRRPLALTRLGMLAERVTRAFWPVWSILLVVLGLLMLGLHDTAPVEMVWGTAVIAALALVWFVYRGARRFRTPSREEALARLDATLRGRPIQTLSDTQAIGSGDLGSEAVWQAHIARMAERVKAARAVQPDLKMASRDPFALRYAAVLLFAVALLFGAFGRVASVGDMGPGGGAALAAGPAWEGWIEPPSYSGKPSLYLADIAAPDVTVPQGSRVTLRLYGEVGSLRIVEDVSRKAASVDSAETPQIAQNFEVQQSGTLEIVGPRGRAWNILMAPDQAPMVAVTGPSERKADGELRLPFRAQDDFGIVSGKATISLDLASLDRRYGLAIAPEPRDDLILDLPLPFNGNRSEFEEVLTDNFSKHPWANMPITIRFEVEDALGQTGDSGEISENLGGLRFFDPLAKAIIEQRRDLLWSRENAARVAQILRAVSYQPKDIFRSETQYLKLRVAIRRLETGVQVASLSTEVQEEVAEALWDLAEQIEYGDLADALERLRRAQDRLQEAMKNGASDEEIASLMEELRQAMQDYMRQLAENAERNGEEQQQAQGETQEITGDQLQEMLDRIQELMEQGRMAEAQALLDQLQQMMENMQVTQGQGGQGQQGEGEQAMEDLQETLREQQGLSDQAFRDLQEQFNPGANAGDAEGNEGRNGGGQGRGAEHDGQGQGGEGDNPDGQQGQNGAQSLADRQQALRDELSRQRGNLPGAGTPEGDAARDALGRAEESMDGAEEALRQGDIAEALDQQSDAMEALREGIRNLGEAMAQQQQQQNGQGQASTNGDPSGRQRDPLGREAGSNGQLGTEENLLQGEDVYRRAEELTDEIRRRSGEQDRPEQELDYLKRLLDRF